MTDPALTAESMPEILLARAGSTPDELLFRFLLDGEIEGPSLTYAELDTLARAGAAALQEVSEPGDRALLLFAPGLEFIAAFFACQYAGVIPVPTYPPRLERLAPSVAILTAVATDCQPRIVLTGGIAGTFVANHVRQVPALANSVCLVCDGIDPSRARSWRAPRIDPDDLALLQYTSGSTAAPRGVMVSHRNLMHNERMFQAAVEHCGQGMGVCWLPPYHDMGLIAGLLQPVFHGAPETLMSPVAFLMDPIRWLRAVDRYRADTIGAPSFAYELCVQRTTPEQRRALDLSHLSVAGVGAEPINPATLERFGAAFAPSGFRPETFYPAYGLAEATLLVTGGAKSALPVVRTFAATSLEKGNAVAGSEVTADSRTLVGCGHPWLGQEIVIADPERHTTCPPGVVGEIWIAGPSVAQGYWNRPEQTERVFRAHLADTGRGPFLRSGDLGFVLDGELFVTGRIKDVIIIHGRNHYPQDIEETVQSVHSGLRPGCGAAFEIDREGRAALVVVQELERRCRLLDVTRLIDDIRQVVAERHQLQLHEVQFLEYGSIPKTSSGKVQRHRCRLGYEQGSLRRWREKGT